MRSDSKTPGEPGGIVRPTAASRADRRDSAWVRSAIRVQPGRAVGDSRITVPISGMVMTEHSAADWRSSPNRPARSRLVGPARCHSRVDSERSRHWTSSKRPYFEKWPSSSAQAPGSSRRRMSRLADVGGQVAERLPLGARDEGLAAAADRQAADVVRRQIVQELRPVRPREEQARAVAAVEEQEVRSGMRAVHGVGPAPSRVVGTRTRSAWLTSSRLAAEETRRRASSGRERGIAPRVSASSSSRSLSK